MAIINKTGITDGGIVQAEHVTRAIDALSGGSTDTVVATGSFSGSFKGDGSGLIGVGAGFPYTGSAKITGSLEVLGPLVVYQTPLVKALDTNARTLIDSSGADSVGWGVRTLLDASTVDSVNWDSRELYNSVGNTVINWEDRNFFGTASFASTASRAVTASFATTASYVANASSFPYTGSAIISGSLIVTGSTNISNVLTVNGSSNFNDVLNANSIFTANAGAEFNDAVNVNVNPLTVNPATYISAKTNIVELNNATTITESVTDYPAGTTFFVAMTSSAATASFQFEPLNGNSIGTSYKILITKYTAGEIQLSNTANDTVFFGHYVDISKPDSFASARSVKITTPEATCIEAYFINGNNNSQWFFDISTAGNLTTT